MKVNKNTYPEIVTSLLPAAFATLLLFVLLVMAMPDAHAFEPIDDFGNWEVTVTPTPTPTPVLTITPTPSATLSNTPSENMDDPLPTIIPRTSLPGSGGAANIVSAIPGANQLKLLGSDRESYLFFLVLFLGSAMLNIILLVLMIYMLTHKRNQQSTSTPPAPQAPKKPASLSLSAKHELLVRFVTQNKHRYSPETLESLLQEKGYPQTWIDSALREAGIKEQAVKPTPADRRTLDDENAQEQEDDEDAVEPSGEDSLPTAQPQSPPGTLLTSEQKTQREQAQDHDPIDELRKTIVRHRGKNIFDEGIFRRRY